MDNMEIKRIFDRNYCFALSQIDNGNIKNCSSDETVKYAQSLTVNYVQTVMNLIGNSPYNPTLLGHDPFHGRTWIVEKPCGLGNSPWDPR